MDNKEVIRILANARFKTRSDTGVNWEKANPVLLAGEPGVVTDGSESEKIKFRVSEFPEFFFQYFKL